MLYRAKVTLEWAMTDIAAFGEEGIDVGSLLISAGGKKHVLDPLNLIFFVKSVLEEDDFFETD